MTGWLSSAIPHLKGVHVSTLVVWCAGLLALPLMLSRYDSTIRQEEYARIRHYTHFAYTLAVTPAGVLAIVSGTLLIFAAEVFVPWMFLKLGFVALLVLAHGWVGHSIAAIGKSGYRYSPPHPALHTASAMIPILGILVLVLAKPGFAVAEFPSWLLEPRGSQLPFDVPSR